MKTLMIILVSVYITLASGSDYKVVTYESADVNNHGGIITSDKTDIDFIIVNEEYIQLKGIDANGDAVGYYFVLNTPVIIRTNGITYYKYIVVKDRVLFDLTFKFGYKLTIINNDKDKIEVFNLEPYTRY